MGLHPRRYLAALVSGAVVGVAAVSAAAIAAPAGADGLSVVAVRQSLLGTHTWYQQTYRGIPVLGGYYATHTSPSGTLVQDGRIAIGAGLAPAASFTQGRAESLTRGRGGSVLRSELVVVPGARPTLAWKVLSDAGHGSVRTVIDAASGAVISSESLVKGANGTGTVFEPNPVVTLQNESLKDNSNKDSAAFAAAYKSVTLTQLDATGYLTGAYAKNTSSTPAFSTTHVYNFNRSQKSFEQVMGYYSITSTQEYIHSLGFTNVNNSSQDYRTTGLTADNSFYDPATDRITFGTGGVDDAEDAEVIWHEYGHAIQDAQVPGFGSSAQAGAIGEGFGDYWAVSMASAVSPNTTTTPWACVMDWDATSYTTTTPHCLRRTDGNKVYPGSWVNEVHADGEMWSRALFDIFNGLGRTQADRIILESQFTYTPGTTFAAAANRVVAAAQALYGSAAATACTNAMHARGFI